MRQLIVVGMIALAGPCSKTAGTSDSGSASAPAAAAAPNPMVLEHVKAHVEGCATVNVEAGQAYGCKPGIREAMSKAFREAKPADFISSSAMNA